MRYGFKEIEEPKVYKGASGQYNFDGTSAKKPDKGGGHPLVLNR